MSRFSRVSRTCLFCGQSFMVKKNVAERGEGVFCSRPCKGAHKTREAQRVHEERFGMPIYDLLHLLHYDRDLGIGAIADLLQASTRTIYDWIADLDFPVRGRSAAVKLQWKDNETRRDTQRAFIREWMQANPDRPNAAQRPDVRAKISANKTGRAVPKLQAAGNANWRGGKIDYRGPDWKEQRTKALDRDGHCCSACGSVIQLEVHHKIPFRISHNNDLSNLITLCVVCHHRAEVEWEAANPVQQRRLRLF